MGKVHRNVKLINESYNLSFPAVETISEEISSEERQAEQILKNARDKAITLREEAFSKGYNEGMKNAAREWEDKLSRLNGLISAFQEERDRFFNESEGQILELIINIAGTVIKRELSEDKDAVLRTVKAGLQKISSSKGLCIRANPEDARMLLDSGIKNSGSNPNDKIEIHEDPGISRGGCIITGTSGEVDARIESQIGELSCALKEAWHAPA